MTLSKRTLEKIEDIEINDKIDTIVSEWMACCLLYDQMLPSVIFAREKYKPEIMVPSRGKIIVCGFRDKKYFQSDINER